MLRYKADRRTIFFVALYFAFTAWLWIAAPHNLIAHIALLAVTCVLSFMGAVATHNALHSPPFKSRPLNRLFQVVLTLTYGSPVSAFVPGHNLSHHRHTQTNRDVMRTSKVRFRYNLFNLMFFVLAVAPAIMKADTSYTRAMYKRNPKWFRQYMIEMGTFIVVSATLFLIDWKKFLLYWMVPHIYAAWGIITINFLQHDGADQETTYNHSRNFVGWFPNWLLYNNGYHTLHHEEPGMHWSLLPAEHAKRIAPFIHPALDQKSMLAYGFKAFFYPGKRLMYDGSPIKLPPRAKDENWIPAPNETPPDVSLGAIPG